MSGPKPPDEVLGYYALGLERGRLDEDYFPLEGPAAYVPDFARRWAEPTSRGRMLAFLRRVETEPSLLGVSPHLLAVARRP